MVEALRRTPMYRQLVPMEAVTGWPWPLRGADGALHLAVPLLGARVGPGGGPATLRPPFARITVRWRTGLPVEYVDHRFSNPWPEADWTAPCGSFPHAALEGLGRGDYLTLVARAYALLDEAFDALEARAPVPPALDAELASLLRRLVHPGLAPFYLALAPGFFRGRVPEAAAHRMTESAR
jgi:hypothetical protein